MINVFHIVVALGVSTLCFGQTPQKASQDSIAAAPSLSEERVLGDTLTLQEYVETLYISTSQLYHKGALPVVEVGNFNVLVVEKNGKGNTMVKSKELATMTIEDVKEIRFEKSKQTDMMYGYQMGDFGMIVITR